MKISVKIVAGAMFLAVMAGCAWPLAQQPDTTQAEEVAADQTATSEPAKENPSFCIIPEDGSEPICVSPGEAIAANATAEEQAEAEEPAAIDPADFPACMPPGEIIGAIDAANPDD